MGTFELTKASAAPAFDTEEQQNIGVYKKALPSVVNITSTEVAFDFFYGPVPQQGQGSGFILDKEGLILTNNHVIGNAQRVEVMLSDKHKYKATRARGRQEPRPRAAQDRHAPNLAAGDALGLAQPRGRPARVRDRQSLRPNGTMTRGIISAIRSIRGPGNIPIEDAIQTDAAVNPGNSGGPLLNSRGEVIGITTMIASNGADQSSGIGFAIPINTARAILDDYAKYGYIRRPTLDIVTLPIGPDIAEQIGLARRLRHPHRARASRRRRRKGRPAWRNPARRLPGQHAGHAWRRPDHRDGGEEITSPQDLAAAMNSHRAGDTVTVTVFRGRKSMDVKVTLGDAPSSPAGG